ARARAGGRRGDGQRPTDDPDRAKGGSALLGGLGGPGHHAGGTRPGLSGQPKASPDPALGGRGFACARNGGKGSEQRGARPMIWLTWQQHGLMVFVGGLVLVLLVPFLIITGLVMIQESHAALACPPPDTINDCMRGFATLVRDSPVLPVLSSLPLLIGAFI